MSELMEDAIVLRELTETGISHIARSRNCSGKDFKDRNKAGIQVFHEAWAQVLLIEVSCC
jgi:hypothetical protein